jgi:hypothetical protein
LVGEWLGHGVFLGVRAVALFFPEF